MNFLKNVFDIFFPKVCLSCSDILATNEVALCVTCRHDLPLTNFSFETNNLVEKAFYGMYPIINGTALFYFYKQGTVQKLIHNLKYKGQQQVGTFIGNWLGEEMLESKRFENLDYIVPVPLHKNKQIKRGYNQVTTFGKSLSKKLNIPFKEDILVRVSYTKTQTKKIRLDRWKNVQELFYVPEPNKTNNKHILLIDDVITTGATLEACCNAFKNSTDIKISIACMAYTK